MFLTNHQSCLYEFSICDIFKRFFVCRVWMWFFLCVFFPKHNISSVAKYLCFNASFECVYYSADIWYSECFCSYTRRQVLSEKTRSGREICNMVRKTTNERTNELTNEWTNRWTLFLKCNKLSTDACLKFGPSNHSYFIQSM